MQCPDTAPTKPPLSSGRELADLENWLQTVPWRMCVCAMVKCPEKPSAWLSKFPIAGLMTVPSKQKRGSFDHACEKQIWERSRKCALRLHLAQSVPASSRLAVG